MTRLRRHRRDHRARAPRKRRRRNLVKFIPSADSDFAHTANQFATKIATNPPLFGLNTDDATCITDAVNAYRTTLAVAINHRTRTIEVVDHKDAARKSAEEVVRRFANIIRANPDVSVLDKKRLRIKQRPTKLKHRSCPSNPPMLQFIGTGDGVAAASIMGAAGGVHVLKFFDYESTNIKEVGKIRRAKPECVVRLELFVGLVPMGQPIPKHPGECFRSGGFMTYMRSFTKSPMEVNFPIPAEPMFVVYWAKWADSAGNTSRFSKTCVARVEGWSHADGVRGHELPAGHELQQIETKCLIVQLPEYALPMGVGDAEDVVEEMRMLPVEVSSSP